jgi:large subunit ribosomal protein L3
MGSAQIFSLHVLGIIGKKIGMTQLFLEDGSIVPVTYISCEPNTVHQVKTNEKDGTDAVVLGAEKLKKQKKTKTFQILKEIAGSGEVKKGDDVTVGIFEDGEEVTVIGTSKGKGFQGPVKRHNFRVARRTHGTKDPRHGSTGACAMPGRSKPGIKMAGRMGNDKVTLRDRTIVRIDSDKNLVAVKGPIPGSNNSFVLLKKQG